MKNSTVMRKAQKILLLLVAFLLFSISYAQNDKGVLPQIGLKIERNMDMIDIEGKKYFDVRLSLKSNRPDYRFVLFHKVKATIKDNKGHKIYKETFKEAYLYVFPNGQIQVGRPGFNQIILTKEGGHSLGIIRKTEGVY